MTDSKKFKSLIEEISAFVPRHKSANFIEQQADHIVTSAVHLLEVVSQTYNAEDVERFERRLLLAIRSKSPDKIKNTCRTLREKTGDE